MKQLFLMLTAIMLLLTACSEKDSTSPSDQNQDNPPIISESVDLELAFPDSSELIDFEATDIEYEGEMVKAYSLEQFIEIGDEIDEISTSPECVFQIVSEDGYSPRNGGNPDLTWNQFKTGYLLPEKKFRTFFPSDNITTAYDVKFATKINLFRAVIVLCSDSDSAIFYTNTFDTEDVYHQAGNGEFYTDPGYKLENFISGYVTNNPESYDYLLTASDNYQVNFTWDDIQHAYWLTTHNKAIFITEEGTELHSSFKKLVSINLIEK